MERKVFLSLISHFQESNKSTFSRSSIRSSKRLKKEGETGYTNLEVVV